MRKILFAVFVLSIVLLVSCARLPSEVKVISADGERTVELASVRTTSFDGRALVKLSDLAGDADLDRMYVDLGSSEESSVISGSDFDKGYIDPVTKELVFDTIMCDCADIQGLEYIRLMKAVEIVLEGESYFDSDPELHISRYLTNTPEKYTYTVLPGGAEVAFEDLDEGNYDKITMTQPEGMVEFRLKGSDQASYLTDGEVPFADPDDYDYYVGGQVYDAAALESLEDLDKVVVMRNTFYITVDAATLPVSIPKGKDEVELSSFISFDGKEGYQYRIIAEDGFSPAPIPWEDFRTGVWLAEEQKSSFPAIPSKKYMLRNLKTIEMVAGAGAPDDIMVQELIPEMERTEYMGEEAIVLADFITIEDPEDHLYKFIASDGYSPEPYTYEDLEKGYWLLESKITMFPHKNFGTNRIRDLERIKILPLE